MLERYSSNQLMILYLGSKALIEDHTTFDLTHQDQHPIDLIQQAMDAHAEKKPAIYEQLSSLSHVLKQRNFTHFRGWYDFSNWANFNHFVMKMYKNREIRNSFSLN